MDTYPDFVYGGLGRALECLNFHGKRPSPFVSKTSIGQSSWEKR